MQNEIAENVFIPVGSVTLEGRLDIPPHAGRMIIFSHGSGSSRFSPRNNYVAGVLNDKGIATLLVDLLTTRESTATNARFDIHLLTQRLAGVTHWVMAQPMFRNYQLAYFGASTGAASALGAAAALPAVISTVVTRGGRPDLAIAALPQVKVPVLLITGSLDDEVTVLNREALQQLGGIKEMIVVEGASHLFEEPGTLQEVAALAADWFDKHLDG